MSELAEGHGEASNAVLRHKARRAVKRFSLQREDIYLAVHRLDEYVYFRRLDADEFRLLRSLSDGKPVGEALDLLVAESDAPVEQLQSQLEGWFRGWAERGWFCRPGGES